MSLEHPLVWIDLEMTGLDVETERIVELAVIVTDGQLEQLHEGPDLVIAQPQPYLDGMVDVVREMHTESGLLEQIADGVDERVAEQQALDFIRQHVPEAGVAPLAGNSIHADRAFLKRYMPELNAHLHYRNVDVSTLKELARRWHPDALESSPQKGGGHRALADIRESVEELRHYRRTLFR